MVGNNSSNPGKRIFSDGHILRIILVDLPYDVSSRGQYIDVSGIVQNASVSQLRAEAV